MKPEPRQSRFYIYTGPKSRSHLCVVSATDHRHALKVARQTFTLKRSAYARPEGGLERQWNGGAS